MQTRIQELIAENEKMRDENERLKMECDRLNRESVQSDHILSVPEEEDKATQSGAASTSLESMVGHVVDENALQNMDIEIQEEVVDTPSGTPQFDSGENDNQHDTNVHDIGLKTNKNNHDEFSTISEDSTSTITDSNSNF